MSRKGFTLVEILVAMVVLEVGLLGVVGTLWLAATTLHRAESLEAGVAAMERAYDSLQAVPSPGSGRMPSPAGEVRWRVEAGGEVRIEYREGGDSVVAALYALAGAPAGAPR